MSYKILKSLKLFFCVFNKLVPIKLGGIDKYERLITYVGDRAEHDVRYPIDATKIEKELNWTPEQTFATGIKNTIKCSGLLKSDTQLGGNLPPSEECSNEKAAFI